LTQTEELEPWVVRIIETTVLKHQLKCPLVDRVRIIELKLSYLLGYLLGAGVIGGTAGAYLAKIV
jgi:hypothetical protein